MRKFLILFLSLFLFACGTGMEEQNNNENENNEQAVEINDSGEELKIETVFSQDMEESVDYSIFSIKLDETGDSILFTGEEEVDRASTYNEMLIDPNDNAHNALNFNPNDNEDRWCSDVRISQNGEYVVYDRHDDGIEFSVYDVKSEKTIKEVEEFDEYINDIIGISNEGVVFLSTTNDNRNAELITYDINTDTKETISLEDMLNIDDSYVEFNTMKLVNDGQQMFVGHTLVLYLIDFKTDSVEEIMNFEEDPDMDLYINKAVFSQDGKYAYYKILDDSLEDDNIEYVFHQLDTDEKTSYKTFEYK